MSQSAVTIDRLVIERYGPADPARILEIGGQTGQPAKSVHLRAAYAAGPGVDLVLERGKALPLKAQSFDLVLVPALFAQDPAFWDTFVDLVRVVRRGGYLCVTVPAGGQCDLPLGDHWRFSRDAGLALEQHSTNRNQPVRLVESFVCEGDERDDFVAIFQRLPAAGQPPRKFIHTQLTSRNVRTWQTSALLHPREDRDRVQELRDQIAELTARDQGREAEIERLKAREAELVTLGRQRDLLYQDASPRPRPTDPEPTAEPQARPDEPGVAAGYLAEREWLRHVHIALAAQPFWWSLLPKRSRRARERLLLQANGLFDSADYLACNPDVEAAGMDPLRHYIWHGISEGRNRGASGAGRMGLVRDERSA